MGILECLWQTEITSSSPESMCCTEKAKQKTHIKRTVPARLEISFKQNKARSAQGSIVSVDDTTRLASRLFFCFSIISQTLPKGKCVLNWSASLEFQKVAISPSVSYALLPLVPTKKEIWSKERSTRRDTSVRSSVALSVFCANKGSLTTWHPFTAELL